MKIKVVLVSNVNPASYIELVSDGTDMDNSNIMDYARSNWSKMEKFLNNESRGAVKNAFDRQAWLTSLYSSRNPVVDHSMGRTGSVDLSDTEVEGRIAGWKVGPVIPVGFVPTKEDIQNNDGGRPDRKIVSPLPYNRDLLMGE